MMTLMARLCGLCAVSAMIQMAMGESDSRGNLRMLSGLLMLHLTLSGAGEILNGLASADSFETALACLMK